MISIPIEPSTTPCAIREISWSRSAVAGSRSFGGWKEPSRIDCAVAVSARYPRRSCSQPLHIGALFASENLVDSSYIKARSHESLSSCTTVEPFSIVSTRVTLCPDGSLVVYRICCHTLPFASRFTFCLIYRMASSSPLSRAARTRRLRCSSRRRGAISCKAVIRSLQMMRRCSKSSTDRVRCCEMPA